MSNADLIEQARDALSCIANPNKFARLMGDIADALERADQDARRYRYMRCASHTEAKHFIRWTGGQPWLICEDELDRECDAALAQEKDAEKEERRG